ncbi:MAG TPA: LysE family translocator [Streptosporangiaceae bacterium]
MAASAVLAFWAVAVMLIAVPGPDWAFVLSSGLRGRTVLPAVSGIVLGYAGITVAVAAGVGAVVASSPALLTGLTVAGGLYLIWHGTRTFARPAPPAAQRGAPAGQGRAILARGMGVSALNPKGLLVFLALLPQFASPRWTWPLMAQLGFLGLIFMLSCAVFYLCLGSVARKILQTHPAAARAITRFSGAAMAVVGVLLLIERLLA